MGITIIRDSQSYGHAEMQPANQNPGLNIFSANMDSKKEVFW